MYTRPLMLTKRTPKAINAAILPNMPLNGAAATWPAFLYKRIDVGPIGTYTGMSTSIAVTASFAFAFGAAVSACCTAAAIPPPITAAPAALPTAMPTISSMGIVVAVGTGEAAVGTGGAAVVAGTGTGAAVVAGTGGAVV